MKTAEQLARRRAVRARCYAKHREKNLEYAAKYRVENVERIKALSAEKNVEYTRRYRQRHPEKSRASTQAWKDANPARRKETQAAYLQKTLARHVTHQHNRRARKAAAGGKLSPDLAQRLFKLQRGLCACCKARLGDDYHLDHIVPLLKGGSNTDENIQLLTAKCNLRKGARDPIAFMQSRGLLL